MIILLAGFLHFLEQMAGDEVSTKIQHVTSDIIQMGGTTCKVR